VIGLGGRIGRLPDDPALLQRLPQLPPPAPERLGPLAQYAQIGARPLFSEDRRPQAFGLDPEGGDAASNPFNLFVLTSVLLTPRLQMVILQPSGGGESVRLKLGEAPEASPAWTLAAVHPRSAVFNGPHGTGQLELRVFNGIGAEAPTAVRAPGASPSMPSFAPPPDAQPAAEQPIATVEAQMEEIRNRQQMRQRRPSPAQVRQQEARQQATPVKTP